MKIRMMRIVVLFITVCVVAAHVGADDVIPPDVAIAVEVIGEVVYQNATDQQEFVRVQVFMKLRQGDLVTVPEETQIQLLFFEEGRQETWQGPVILELLKEESFPRETDNDLFPTRVEELPDQIAATLSQPEVLFSESEFKANQISRVGGALTRGDQEIPALSAAREKYSELKQREGEAGVTPELYLLHVLALYKQYTEMEQMMTSLLQQYPENQMLRQWMEWLQQGAE